jgi:hypothetical protein
VKGLILIALVVVLAAAAVSLLRSSGPRVTRIERREHIDDHEDRR